MFGKSKEPKPPKKENPIDKLKNNTAKNWWSDPGMRMMMFPIFIGFAGGAQSGYSAPLIGSLIANPRFIMNLMSKGPISSAQLGLVVVGASIGNGIGLIPGAIIADRWGRKMGVFVGSVWQAACAVGLAMANGPWELFGMRLLSAVGASIIGVSNSPYTAEVCHPRNRAVVTALINTCFYIGSIMGSWISYGTLKHIDGDWSWRLPMLLQSMIPILTLIILPFCEESPRWLISKGRIEEGHRILAKYHANGDMDDELVQYELAEIETAKKVAAEAQAGVGYGEFFRTKGNRHRFIIVMTVGLSSQWVGNGIITLYIVPILNSVGITDPLDQNAFNGGLQVWNWFAAVGGALYCERVGRRFLWLFSAFGQLVSYIIITLCSALYAERGNVTAGYCVLAFLFIYFWFYSIAFTGLMLAYPLEVLPNRLRSKGISVLLFGAMIASAVNQFVNTIAFDAIQWRYYFVFIGTICICIIVMWKWFPETRGRTLEQIAEIFDGPQVKVGKDEEDLKEVHTRHESGVDNMPTLDRT